MERDKNQIITWVNCLQLQQLTLDNQGTAAVSRRIISSFKDLVRALRQFQHFIKPSFFLLFEKYIYITFCNAQSSFTYIIFLVLPTTWVWLGDCSVLLSRPVSSWGAHSGSREERIWGLHQRELAARSRQELPIFSVIKIMAEFSLSLK